MGYNYYNQCMSTIWNKIGSIRSIEDVNIVYPNKHDICIYLLRTELDKNYWTILCYGKKDKQYACVCSQPDGETPHCFITKTDYIEIVKSLKKQIGGLR